MWQAVGPGRVERMVSFPATASRALIAGAVVPLAVSWAIVLWAVCTCRSTVSWMGFVPSLIPLFVPQGEGHRRGYRAISTLDFLA